MEILEWAFIIESVETTSSLEYVDLSGNDCSPWGVYCVIIRQCSLDSLTLCGDYGIEEHFVSIQKSFKINPALVSITVTLCNIEEVGIKAVKANIFNIQTIKLPYGKVDSKKI